MKVIFYGVRGSIAVPGPSTIKYGGNTSCVHVQLNNGANIVLDAGTGIRPLGYTLARSDDPIYLMVSHRHWDHVLGFPFFDPIYEKDRPIRIFTGNCDLNELEWVLNQMDGAYFPVRAIDLPSHIEQWGKPALHQAIEEIGVDIFTKSLNHPGSGCAFKIVEDGVSLLYVTDNELEPPGKLHTTYDEWVAFCHGADILIHDAQYTQEDMPHKHGWGHSLVSQVRQLARDAEVKRLILFHHDPQRTDSQLDEIQLDNDAFFKGSKAVTTGICAWEGLEIEL